MAVSGTYAVVVLPGNSNPHQGEYQLRVTTLTPPGVLESENNDTIANADVLLLADDGLTRFGTVAGYIGISNDRDYFEAAPQR